MVLSACIDKTLATLPAGLATTLASSAMWPSRLRSHLPAVIVFFQRPAIAVRSKQHVRTESLNDTVAPKFMEKTCRDEEDPVFKSNLRNETYCLEIKTTCLCFWGSMQQCRALPNVVYGTNREKQYNLMLDISHSRPFKDVFAKRFFVPGSWMYTSCTIYQMYGTQRFLTLEAWVYSQQFLTLVDLKCTVFWLHQGWRYIYNDIQSSFVHLNPDCTQVFYSFENSM